MAAYPVNIELDDLCGCFMGIEDAGGRIDFLVFESACRQFVFVERNAKRVFDPRKVRKMQSVFLLSLTRRWNFHAFFDFRRPTAKQVYSVGCTDDANANFFRFLWPIMRTVEKQSVLGMWRSLP